MDKLQKKCLLGSLLFHMVLLASVALFAGFSRKSQDYETFTQITIVDLDKVLVTDGPTRGGGSGSLPPIVAPVQPKPAQQILQPQPVPQPTPPARPTPKNVEPVSTEPATHTSPKQSRTIETDSTKDDVSIDGKLPPKKSTGIKISTNLVVRKGSATAKGTSASVASNKGATSKVYEQFNAAIQNIGAGLTSGGLHINDIPGFGGGGPAMVNYTQLIMNIFDRAWTPPSEITDENLITEVRIVIHRTGKVTSTRITKRSGNAAMDASVQRALDSIESVPPFPPEARDFERTFNIQFNLKSKLSRG
ncbi:MAG: energy transducer TonB [Verrucomicrobiia bacterium]